MSVLGGRSASKSGVDLPNLSSQTFRCGHHRGLFALCKTNHKTYSVQLNPIETCNCPSTTTCWHIIAAKLSVGVLNTTSTKWTINLSQLKRNSRTRVDKKSGQKWPRPNNTDTEIIPAPDSKESVSASNESNIIVKKQKNHQNVTYQWYL